MSDTKTQEPADLRAAYDTLKAAHDAQTAEYHSFKTTTVFKEVGLPAKHAELYLAKNPDGEVTAEAVQAFADEYGLMPAEAAAPAPPASAEGHLPADGSPPPAERTLTDGPQPADAALASITAAAGSPEATAATAQPAMMNPEEFQKLLQTNPELAAQAYAEGRVRRNEQNVQAAHLQSKGEIR